MKKLLTVILILTTIHSSQAQTSKAKGFIHKGKIKKAVTFIIPTSSQTGIDERKIQKGISYLKSGKKSKVKPSLADSLVFDWNNETMVIFSKSFKVGNTIPKKAFLIPHIRGVLTYYHLAMKLYSNAANNYNYTFNKNPLDGNYLYHIYVEKKGKGIRYIPDLYVKAYMKKFVSDCDYIMNDFNDGKWNRASIEDVVRAYNENCDK